MEKQWWSNGEYTIIQKRKINAAADTAAYLVQDQAGEWIWALYAECVCVIESSFLRVRVRCRQASLLLLLWKKTHVQLDNHLSVPSLNKYENHLYIRISCKYCTWQDKTQFESISFGFFLANVSVFLCVCVGMRVYWQFKSGQFVSIYLKI